ncbi:hypothetical protein [Flavobacterium hercynium]|uniref:WG repeat-containing protein n=1 Tax=Flavobacterium hercynium TaxID=387094 RepID=A0A226GU13_9FLAO|nr:hypothetical protein [Flavobacterium hercynium]OXA84941.1 hypothetical protein B0A66_19975 [Flavobacterium hercynium]SMP34976.1 hypothetical protein SAMN06265346_11912 [Flavobacterium hercynium]
MIKKLSFTVLLIFNFAFSQGNYNDSIKKVIEKDFAKIGIAEFKNLVPFHTFKGMGYLNSKDNKVVVKPTYSNLDFSKPNLKGRYKQIFFEIDSKTKDVKIFDDNFRIMGMGSDSSESNKKDSSISQGFSVDIDNNKIYSYSSSYSSEPYLFLYKKNYYAIVEKDGKYAVVRRNGETLENLGFEYTALKKYDIGNNIVWFKYKTKDNQEGFVNINGEKRVVNNLIKDSNNRIQGFFDFIDTKSSITTKYYGYSIEYNDKLYGVFDLINMDWLIKPQKKFKIIDINYSVEEPLSEKYDLNDRKKLKFYFLIGDGDKAKDYYIDSEFTKYIPKNK